ncbi:alpha/beta hydrolase [Pseudomonas fluorescens]|uniref:Dienelactone hydrolase domain-containing protein n=1 Tax=Pseudomonas fluorescens TaxID=294 RepID=A0A5E7VM87_PSEFL|nr:alpha/beta hydrolase [Pseudomonas fluorescens]VVQ23736.1 putative protein YcjY [Pseudomonas fluorescens]
MSVFASEVSQNLSRRSLSTVRAVLTGALFFLGSVANASDSETAQKGAVQAVTFKNGLIDMAGNVYLPASFDQTKKYVAVVVVHPGGGVKEQTAGVYAKRLSEQGFVALAFDASHQGASGGIPRFLDDPMKRVGDIYSAIDYLETLRYVDASRIGALGICAGSGHAIKATTTDRRIKAVATVSAVDVGAAFRKGWDGRGTVESQLALLNAVAKQRSAEAAGAEPVYVPYLPNVGDKSAPNDLQEAADYYLTPRGQHPNAPNKMLLTSASYMVSYTGFDQVETLLTQPLLVIAGTEAGSLWHSEELYAKAPGQKEFFRIKGATHMDLYDGAGVGIAMDKLSPFFSRNL